MLFRSEVALAPLGLRLHPDKTRIVHLRNGAEGFDFLGFHHHMVESWKWPGRYHLQCWPSTRAMASLRTKVREMTDRRYVGLSLDVVVQRLNPVLRGWAGYFRHGNSARKFSAIDSYVAERMAIRASNKLGLSGRNWATRFTHEWSKSLGLHTLSGNVVYGTTHARR